MENRKLEKKYGKQDAERLLSEINGWIHHADNKASILIAFLALLVGLTTNIYKALEIVGDNLISSTDQVKTAFLIIILSLYFCCMLLTIIFLALVLVARKSVSAYKRSQEIANKSFLFYKDIVAIGYKEFKKVVNQVDEEDIIDELNKQIVINSYIAKRKYYFFNCALISSLILLICTIFLLILINI